MVNSVATKNKLPTFSLDKGDMQKVLLITDVVDSTKLTGELGDARMAEIWTAHDKAARKLLDEHQGMEVDRTDGFFLMFDTVRDAVNYAHAFHSELEKIEAEEQIDFRSRIGIHKGEIILLGQTGHQAEVEGIAKPTTARVMSIARGGQTLLTDHAYREIAGQNNDWETISHGTWRMKGVKAPMEVMEVALSETNLYPPDETDKAYRVNKIGGLWIPVKDTPNNLGLERNAFVGRKDELHQLRKMLEEDSNMVTISGTGGVGKSRFALRFCRSWMGDYPGGVWFCNVENATDLRELTQVVATTMGVPLNQRDPVAHLGNAILGRGKCLIVLDNFDRLDDISEDVLNHWVNKTPEAVYLITSRSILDLPGERVIDIKPLPLDAEAITLFDERARDRKRNFKLSGKNRKEVSEIVRILDGIPLAIELAAARISILSPLQIRQRLADRFKLLSRGSGKGGRQQTLAAAIEWSWELLEKHEQEALMQCSVFRGGFTMEAVDAVIDLSEMGIDWAVDVVQSLVDKSLLVVSQDEEPRYSMYATIQEYCAIKLAESDSPDYATPRHASYFASFGEPENLDELYLENGPEQMEAYSREIDNLISACQYSLSMLRFDETALLLSASWEVLASVGPFSLIRELAEEIMATLEEYEDIVYENEKLMVAHVLGSCYAAMGKHEKAVQNFKKGLSITDKNVKYRRKITGKLGVSQRNLGKFDESLHTLKLNLILAQESDDKLLQTAAHGRLGSVYEKQGKYKEAEESYMKAVDLAKEIGAELLRGSWLGNLGIVSFVQNDYGRARSFYEEAIKVARKVHDKRNEGIFSGNLAEVCHRSGDVEAANEHLRNALQLAKELGDRRSEGAWLGTLGEIALTHEDYPSAAGQLEGAIHVFRECGDAIFENVCQGYLGLAYSKLGKHDQSSVCFEQAAKFFEDKNMQPSRASLLLQWSEALLNGEKSLEAKEQWSLATGIIKDLSLGDESVLSKESKRIKTKLFT